jgi:hypothetical protein
VGGLRKGRYPVSTAVEVSRSSRTIGVWPTHRGRDIDPLALGSPSLHRWPSRDVFLVDIGRIALVPDDADDSPRLSTRYGFLLVPQMTPWRDMPS